MSLARPWSCARGPCACAWLLLAVGGLGCTTPPPEFTDGTGETTVGEPSSTGLAESTTLGPPTGTGLDDTSTSGDPSTSGPGSSSSDTGVPPLCGNAIAEPGEECDDVDLADGTCEAQGFEGGTLACADDCTYDVAGCGFAPAAPTLALAFSPVKQFDFSWAAVADAEVYRLLESPVPGDAYVQIGGDVVATALSVPMPLHLRTGASYVLSACNAFGCTDSDPVDVMGSLAEAVGYVKASNTGADDAFGFAVAISGDGDTLAVGAPGEDSSADGIGGAQGSGANESGAAYVFVRDPTTNAWTQQAYVKASNSDAADGFGVSVALSDDGSTLVVGADLEDSSATSINGSQAGGANNSGAAYVFVRDGAGAWSQQAYVKPFNTGADDRFGWSVALSGDGDTLAVGAWQEDSSATGIGGNGADGGAANSGAVYVFVRNAADQWSQQAYVKASNTDQDDTFGWSVALSGDGSTLAVGADLEDGGAAGIGGDQADDSLANAGAVYVFVRDGVGAWSQEAYVKASNPDPDDGFGWDVALSEDGNTLVVGAPSEDGDASGVGGDETSDAAPNAGAAYVLVRDPMTGTWSQEAYVKASNPDVDDHFGAVVSVSGDASVLAVAAWDEASGATGLGGDQADDGAAGSGACYVLLHDAGTWQHETYVKAPNAETDDLFSGDLALSSDGRTLVVGAEQEDSSAMGLDGDQGSSGASASGATYLY